MIETNQELKLKKLLYFKGRIPQSEIENEIEKIKSFLDEKEISIIGPKISSINSIDDKNPSMPIVNFELLYPIDKPFTKTEKYKFKRKFELENCLKIHIKDTLENIQQELVKLDEYIINSNLKLTTNLYTVDINEPVSHTSNIFDIEAYVSVKDSDL